MTPDELFTRLHTQRADLIAMRAALEDLAGCLPLEVRQQWLGDLRDRTLRLTRAADAEREKRPDTAQALQVAAEAVSRLHRTLEAAAFPDPEETV